MSIFSIPYHRGTLDFDVPEKNLRAVITARTEASPTLEEERDIVRKALASPIGTPRLSELARGKKKVVLVTSDHTRPLPSRITLPLLLEEIRRGAPGADITILIATGLHRAPTLEEQKAKFGEEIVRNERIAVNDAYDASQFVHICTLPSGSDFQVNRLAAECDLLVTEGFIEPHAFAGFSGGRKSILPGICSEKTINQNHSYKAVGHPGSMPGRLDGNVIHDDMLFAARRMGTAFIFNVALNGDKKIIAAFAGDLEKAHAEGCGFVRAHVGRKAVRSDIVITSNGGYPLDQNLYQSGKCILTGSFCANEGGVIIACTACSDGIGGENFARLIFSGSVAEIDSMLSGIAPEKTISEQWSLQHFIRVLKHHTVIIVSDMLDPEIIRKAHCIPARTPEEALRTAFALKGEDAAVTVVPDGVSILLED